MGISSCCFQTKKAHRVTDDLKSMTTFLGCALDLPHGKSKNIKIYKAKIKNKMINLALHELHS